MSKSVSRSDWANPCSDHSKAQLDSADRQAAENAALRPKTSSFFPLLLLIFHMSIGPQGS